MFNSRAAGFPAGALVACVVASWIVADSRPASGQVLAHRVPASRPHPLPSGSPRTQPALWLDRPVLLDGAVGAELGQELGRTLHQALERSARGPIAYGPGAFQESGYTEDSGEQPGVKRARDLLAKGEGHFMAFQFAPAAASLAEAAGLFASALAGLEQADMRRLYKARLLEGAAWTAAGQKVAAKEAFAKLLTIRPHFPPTHELLPPTARSVFREALDEARARGVGTILLQSEPPGAELTLDGQARGRAPVRVEGIPPGQHAVQVRLAGHLHAARELSVVSGKVTSARISLKPTPATLAYRRLREAVRSGQSLKAVEDEVHTLAQATGCPSIALVALARRKGRIVVTMRRWSQQGQAAVVVVVEQEQVAARMASAAPLLLSASWPTVQAVPQAPAVAVDFHRALIGIGPDWGGGLVVSKGTSVFKRWWFWAGVGAVAAAAVGIGLSASGGSAQQPDQTRFVFQFP